MSELDSEFFKPTGREYGQAGSLQPGMRSALQRRDAISGVRSELNREKAVRNRLFRQLSRQSRRGSTRAGARLLDLFEDTRRVGQPTPGGISSYEGDSEYAAQTIIDRANQAAEADAATAGTVSSFRQPDRPVDPNLYSRISSTNPRTSGIYDIVQVGKDGIKRTSDGRVIAQEEAAPAASPVPEEAPPSPSPAASPLMTEGPGRQPQVRTGVIGREVSPISSVREPNADFTTQDSEIYRQRALAGGFGSARMPSPAPAAAAAQPQARPQAQPAAVPEEAAPTPAPEAAPASSGNRPRLQTAMEEWRARQGFAPGPELDGPPRPASDEPRVESEFIKNLRAREQREREAFQQQREQAGQPAPESTPEAPAQQADIDTLIKMRNSPEANTIRGARSLVPASIMARYPEGTEPLTVMDDIRSFYDQGGDNFAIDVDDTVKYAASQRGARDAASVREAPGILLQRLGVGKAFDPVSNAAIGASGSVKSIGRRLLASGRMGRDMLTGRSNLPERAQRYRDDANRGDLQTYLNDMGRIYGNR